ncbi:hypothetical protein [Natronoglycomyces albus]|uniref:Uncharacterized protein n=1 Tax=Natronoglycomyces albus TaxID=2811108 RepID=A0A895XF03_9ACTN|nr:hypothetical protein [Natronoglycomyces albus]QSB04421.1 hypothetical protein JQS30_11545 [Natronoglycomyces albus]
MQEHTIAKSGALEWLFFHGKREWGRFTDDVRSYVVTSNDAQESNTLHVFIDHADGRPEMVCTMTALRSHSGPVTHWSCEWLRFSEMWREWIEREALTIWRTNPESPANSRSSAASPMG